MHLWDSARSPPSEPVQTARLRLMSNLAEERALFRTFLFAAAVTMGGLGLASQPASAVSPGGLPAAARADLDTLTEVQYWEEPRYQYRRSYQEEPRYRYGRSYQERRLYEAPPSYGYRRYSAPRYYEPPRYRRYGATRRQAAPPVRGCYTPPPMGYRTPRVVCSY